MKRCSTCKKLKKLEEFNRNKSSADGKHNQCKECHIKIYFRNHEKNKQRLREYAERHREENRRRAKKNYYKDRDKKLKYQKEYAFKNKDKIKAYKQSEKGRESNSKSHKKSRKLNHDKLIIKERKYRQSEQGRLARKKSQVKRRRNLKFIPLFNNPFPREIKVDYHHINNLLVIPLPRITHQSGYGNVHKEKMNKIIKKIFGIDILEFFIS